ncbi:MAG: type II secretion system F family protein [Candidatus Pacearchaeota archaeon]
MKPKKRINLTAVLIVALVLSTITFIFTKNALNSIIVLIASIAVILTYISTKKKLAESQKIRMMEVVFPDFLQLISSNLKAGIPIDKAIVISSRKEFSPLDEQINQFGRDIVTGKPVELAMKEMSVRINSEKISKTINLIITGMRSGGNLATLLEQTSANLKERQYVEKRAASNIIMYIILILFAVGVGAPILFSLSTVLVGVLTQILSGIPEVQTSIATPFAFTSINISSTFITYFAVFFIITIDILGSMVIGLVQKGEEREGLKYAIPLILLSLTMFFLLKVVLASYFKGILG